MPTLRLYPSTCAAVIGPFGGDLGSGTSVGIWDGSEGAAQGAPDTNTADCLTVSGVASGDWICDNLQFSAFLDAQGTALTSLIPSSAVLTGAVATLHAALTIGAGNVLLYTRVNSALTNASKGAREGGFALLNGLIQQVALQNTTTTPIIGSRSGTPLTMADFLGANLKIVVGFLANGGTTSTSRQIMVDALALDITYTSGPTTDRAPTASGLLASRFRRFSRT